MPTPNVNRQPTNGGANAAPLQIKCWKCQGPHYARDCTNKTNELLHNLQEDHHTTMVEIEGKVSNTAISILINPGAFQSYVSPKIVETCKLDKVTHEKSWMVQLDTSTK